MRWTACGAKGGGPELFEGCAGNGGEGVEVGEVVENEIGAGQGGSDLRFLIRAGDQSVVGGWMVRAFDR